VVVRSRRILLLSCAVAVVALMMSRVSRGAD